MTNSPIFSGQFTLRQRHQLPDQAGIYEREQLLYIGQAKNLRDRWAGSTHHRYKQFARKGLDKIILRYILTSVSELDKWFFRTCYAKLPQTTPKIFAKQGFWALFRVNLDG
jgi:hypothetical protein